MKEVAEQLLIWKVPASMYQTFTNYIRLLKSNKLPPDSSLNLRLLKTFVIAAVAWISRGKDICPPVRGGVFQDRISPQ